MEFVLLVMIFFAFYLYFKNSQGARRIEDEESDI